jgi:hypothetical protein
MNPSRFCRLYVIAVIASSLLTITAITDLSVAREADAKRVGDCDATGGSSECSGGSGGRTVDSAGSVEGGSGDRVVCDGSECTTQGGRGGHSVIIDEGECCSVGSGGLGGRC